MVMLTNSATYFHLGTFIRVQRGGHEDGQSFGAPHLRRQADRPGFIQSGEENTPVRPHYGLLNF